MEDSETVVETKVEKVELKHQFGKFFVGGIAAYLADQAASAAYDKILHAIRARKVR